MGREFRIYLGGGAEVFAGMGTRLGTLKFRAFAHSLSLSVPLSLSLSLSFSLSPSLYLSLVVLEPSLPQAPVSALWD